MTKESPCYEPKVLSVPRRIVSIYGKSPKLCGEFDRLWACTYSCAYVTYIPQEPCEDVPFPI